MPYTFWKLTFMKSFVTPNVNKDITSASLFPSNFTVQLFPTLHCRVTLGTHQKHSADLVPASHRPEREKHFSLVLSHQTPNPELLHNIIKARPSHLWKKKKAEHIVMGSLRSTLKYVHKYHDSIVDTNCYLKTPLESKC